MRYEELLEQLRVQNTQLREAIERQSAISEDTRRQYDQMVHRLQQENHSLQQSLEMSQRQDRSQEVSSELQAMHMKQMDEWHQRALDYQRQIAELEMKVRVRHLLISIWAAFLYADTSFGYMIWTISGVLRAPTKV